MTKGKAEVKLQDFYRDETHDFMGHLSPIAPNVNLTKLAKRAGICQSHMSKIVSRSRVPSVAVVQRIALSLGVTVDEALRKIQNQDW